jgi:hypothetical protein
MKQEQDFLRNPTRTFAPALDCSMNEGMPFTLSKYQAMQVRSSAYASLPLNERPWTATATRSMAAYYGLKSVVYY